VIRGAYALPHHALHVRAHVYTGATTCDAMCRRAHDHAHMIQLYTACVRALLKARARRAHQHGARHSRRPPIEVALTSSCRLLTAQRLSLSLCTRHSKSHLPGLSARSLANRARRARAAVASSDNTRPGGCPAWRPCCWRACARRAPPAFRKRAAQRRARQQTARGGGQRLRHPTRRARDRSHRAESEN
jgi:hypothetical protein